MTTPQFSEVRVFPARPLGLHVAKMNRSQWEQARTKMALDAIGGSEIGVLLLKSERKYNSPIRMFYQRLGLWPDNYRDNKYAFMGRALEDQIVKLWRAWAGTWDETMQAYEAGVFTRKSQACRYILKNPKYPTLLANIDNRIIKSPDSPTGRGILECKTLSSHVADRYETGVPTKHVIQVQQYMLVTGEQYAELAVLKSGVDFDVYPVNASAAIQNRIVEATEDFFFRVNEARKDIARLGPNASEEEKTQAAQIWEPTVEFGGDEYDFLSEKARRLESTGESEPPADVVEWFTDAVVHAATAKEAEAARQLLLSKIRQQMILDNVYRYAWDGGVITNGNRFTLRERT
jgi:predicted phage-related endonuclease